jgi:high-affinity Fe2+/Pb2+ permease
VRRLVGTEIGLVVTFVVGMFVAYIGLAVSISGHERAVGVLVLAAGVWLMLAAPVVHDRVHRDAGQSTHALWGRDDRWKPSWWRTR